MFLTVPSKRPLDDGRGVQKEGRDVTSVVTINPGDFVGCQTPDVYHGGKGEKEKKGGEAEVMPTCGIVRKALVSTLSYTLLPYEGKR